MSRFSQILLSFLTPILLCTSVVYAQDTAADEATGNSWIQERIGKLDGLFGDTVELMAGILFADFGTGMPVIVAVLLLGGIYYSFYFGWLSLRGLKHSIDIIRGCYDDPDDPGEISHFKALTSALSATIGLGNIASVAVAMGTGGPGALFWMVLTAFFGMASKLASCTLAVMYREIHPDGRVSGGPMYYLEKGLGAKGLRPLGRTLAVLFALL
ncbi:MAG: sodium:alanine symporter family protein, partial [Gemmatimonadetes bacterium]|nr:sodium:alanine symporter family protein [Gemmatimonadota bacterium]